MKWCIKILKRTVFDYLMEIPMVLAQARFVPPSLTIDKKRMHTWYLV